MSAKLEDIKYDLDILNKEGACLLEEFLIELCTEYLKNRDTEKFRSDLDILCEALGIG